MKYEIQQMLNQSDGVIVNTSSMVLLASSEGSFMTGSLVEVSGGIVTIG